MRPDLPDIGLVQLTYFAAVAEAGGFQAAAARLGRSQPAVSQAVRALEEQLGGRLIVPGSRGTLTPLGESFYPLATELLTRSSRTVQTGRNLAAGVAGHVTLAAVPSVASRILPRVLSGFLAQRPDVHVTLIDEPSADAQRRIQEGRGDLAIASGERAGSDVVFEPLFDDPVVAVCGASHPMAAAAEPVSWAELAAQRLIDNGTTDLLADAHQRAAFAEAPLTIPNIVSLLASLEAGLGVTTLPRLAVPAERALAVKALADVPASPRRVGVVRPAQAHLPPVAAALHASLVDRLPPAAAAAMS